MYQEGKNPKGCSGNKGKGNRGIAGKETIRTSTKALADQTKPKQKEIRDQRQNAQHDQPTGHSITETGRKQKAPGIMPRSHGGNKVVSWQGKMNNGKNNKHEGVVVRKVLYKKERS
jgi:hypothetical protein